MRLVFKQTAAALLMAALAACTPAAPAVAPAVAPPPAAAPAAEAKAEPAAPARPTAESTPSYAGEVRSAASLTVVPRASGRVEKLYVEVGAAVKAGDRIAELDKETASLGVRQQEAALKGARARLEALRAGARPEVVAQADAAARAASAGAESAAAAARPEVVAQAEVALDDARLRLAGMESGRSEVVAQADAGVVAAQARLDALTKDVAPERVRAQEIAIEAARRGLEGSWAQRDGVCGYGDSSFCDSARAAVLQAETAVRQAEQQLVVMRAPADAGAVAELRAAVDIAKEQAKVARRPAGAGDLAAARAQVRAAAAGMAAARQGSPPGAVEAARAQAEAAAAGAALAADPYTREELAVAEAQVAQAEAELEIARAQLGDMTILAPVDGVVVERPIVVGAVASPVTPIVAIAAPELEVSLSVEESRLARIRTGQTARVTVAAYPGESFGGTVKLIAPTVDTRSRNGAVKIALDAEALGKLRPGMLAQVVLAAG